MRKNIFLFLFMLIYVLLSSNQAIAQGAGEEHYQQPIVEEAQEAEGDLDQQAMAEEEEEVSEDLYIEPMAAEEQEYIIGVNQKIAEFKQGGALKRPSVNVSGEWEIMIHGINWEGSPGKSPMTLEQNGNKVTGTIQEAERILSFDGIISGNELVGTVKPINPGEEEGFVVSFALVVDSMLIKGPYNSKIAGDKTQIGTIFAMRR